MRMKHGKFHEVRIVFVTPITKNGIGFSTIVENSNNLNRGKSYSTGVKISDRDWNVT